MGAFDAFQTKPQPDVMGKYSGYDVGALEATAKRTTPSPQGAASQGAVGNPASAGGAPAFGDEGKGAGEARKPEYVSDFHKMHSEGDDSDKDAVADKMEAQFAEQGLSLQGAVNMVFEQGGETAMQLADKFGYIPAEKRAGTEAFKTREEALSDYNVEMDEAKERGIAEKKKTDNRRAMGGFLMDVGLRMLASNRDDAGGALGEGVLGAQKNRRDTKRQDAADKMASDDRARQTRRQDESDEMARQREARAVEQSEYDKSQRGAKEEQAAQKNLEQIVAKDGTVHYVNPEEGVVQDEEGVPIRKATAAELSAAQQATNRRARERSVVTERTRIRKLVEGGYSDDPEVSAIIEEKDPTARRAMINELADKNAQIESEEISDYLDW